MSWIFGTLAEFQESPVMINLNSISMVAGSPEGGCAIFFSEPQSRIALRESYEEIHAQMTKIKKMEGDPDSSFFQASGQKSLTNNSE